MSWPQDAQASAGLLIASWQPPGHGLGPPLGRSAALPPGCTGPHPKAAPSQLGVKALFLLWVVRVSLSFPHGILGRWVAP